MAKDKVLNLCFKISDPITRSVVSEISQLVQNRYDGYPEYMKPTAVYTEKEATKSVAHTPDNARGINVDNVHVATGNLLGNMTDRGINGALMLGYQENDVQTLEKAYNAFKKLVMPNADVSKTQFKAPLPAIKDVIYHDPAVIVLWKDGTKTVAKASGEDMFSPEIGLAMAIAKKVTGNYENFEALLPHEPVKVEEPPKKQMKHWGVRYIYNKNVEGRTDVDAYTEKAAGNIVRMRVAHDARCSADDVHILEVKEGSGRYAWADVPANEKTTSTYDVEMDYHIGPNSYVTFKATKRVQAANSTDARDQAVAWCAAEHDIPLSNISILSILDVYDEE